MDVGAGSPQGRTEPLDGSSASEPPELRPRELRVMLPDIPTRYPMFWRTPGSEWWLNLVALVIPAILSAYAGWFALMLAFEMGIPVIPAQDGPGALPTSDVPTPALIVPNNLWWAALLPIAFVASLILGQRPRWLSSVVGRFRWGWSLRCLLVLLPMWIVVTGLQTWASPPTLQNHALPATVLAVITLTPLRYAGEEFAFRGVLNRAVASWFSRPLVGLVVGGVVSSTVFTLAHWSDDPWQRGFYFTVGLAGCYLAWRTGGLEAPIALHVVINLRELTLTPWLRVDWMLVDVIEDPGVGNAGPSMLLQIAMVLISVGLVEWQARRTQVVAVNDPGRKSGTNRGHNSGLAGGGALASNHEREVGST